MGWKNVKEHYDIGHIVQVLDGAICIGSQYVHNIIKIVDYKPRWDTALRASDNDELARYFEEMTSDLVKLRDLIDAPDAFEKSIPVFTYDMGQIIEKQCEELGWPNCTHDGQIMYENRFSTDRSVGSWLGDRERAIRR